MGRKFSNTVIVVLLACAFAIGLSDSVQAFDGKRKGLILGVGGGYSPLTHFTYLSYEHQYYDWYSPGDSVFRVEVYSPSSQSRNEGGAEFQIDIGYAFDERNAIYLREQQVLYSTSPALSTGITAVCWSHYFGETGNTLFSTMGVGQASAFYYDTDDMSASVWDGLGLLIGIGYEFKEHFSLEVDFCQSQIDGYASRSHLSIMFTSTAY
jgi:hypothetical protein